MILRRALLLGLCTSIPFIVGRIDAIRGEFAAQEEVLYFATGAQVRRVLPGFENVMADIYWLRTVQYYGSQLMFAKRKRFDLLEPLVTITTTLDPRFAIAYRYGAVFLCQPYPSGAGRAEAGIALLERGVRENPRDWLMWQNLAFYTFLYTHDYRRAAQAAISGGQQPDAPDWLLTLAPELARRGGDRGMAREMWRRFHETAESDVMKQTAVQHLKMLAAADVADVLNAKVREFRAARGRNPSDWRELRQAGLLRVQPIDPSGAAFDYDAKSGKFSVSQQSELWSVQ